ncbi:DUF1990 family protein [Protaetiibacter larvae]|uniref:DUF1990 family protein n=1 Tax=Protaetiibacter larvae TaxID=2592654 RepID=UPI00143CF46F|nr:DUF1990 domain-containing protein [Protaetiibacter larvae]
MSASELNYGPVGISRPGATAPAGLREREQRIRLGSGEGLWARAVDAVSGWAIKKRVRFTVTPDDASVVLGRDYDTRFGIGALRLLEPVRVVWVEESGERRGFGYGTRVGHPITGEECFLVERDADGVVWLVVRTVSRVSRGRWLVLWPGIRLMQPVFQRRYARAALRLIVGADALPGMRGLRRTLVGEGSSSVDGIAKLGYGMNPERGPFDEPPAEPVQLDADALPWELREPDGEASPPRNGT